MPIGGIKNPLTVNLDSGSIVLQHPRMSDREPARVLGFDQNRKAINGRFLNLNLQAAAATAQDRLTLILVNGTPKIGIITKLSCVG